MKKYSVVISMFLLLIILASCNSNAADASDEEENVETVTPVTITHPTTANMQETVEINAVAAYLLKTFAKANAVGYLQTANVHLGQFVTKGQMLFVIKTKEAEALGNTITSIDSSLYFSGTIKVIAPGSGY